MGETTRFYPGQATEAVSERERLGRAVARRAAAEGMVLLENDGVLPLQPGAKLALFGTGARHTIKGGTGSGDVNSRDTVSVDAGLRAAGFEILNTAYLDAFDAAYAKAREEWEQAIYAATGGARDYFKLYTAHAKLSPRMPEDIAIPREACQAADAAIYVISRVSGEGADRNDAEGDYYLSAAERADLETLCACSKKVIVVLNVGGIIDLGFMEEYPIAALVLMSQAGVEGGSALADVLSGAVNPSGRLTDTYARRYEDYPSSENFSHRNGNLIEEYYTDGIYVGYRYFDSFGVGVRYPFGYGLSYTTFTQAPEGAVLAGTEVAVKVRVRNTGAVAGRQVVQLYAACPAVEQLKEFKRLVAFGKTALLAPGAEEALELRFDLAALTSYRTAQAAYYLEKGVYTLLAGPSAAEFAAAARLTLAETVKVQQLSNVCELLDALIEIAPDPARVAERDAALAGLAANAPVLAIDEAVRALCEKLQTPVRPALDADLLAKAQAITAGLSDEEKTWMVVGAPSRMSGEEIGAAANAVPGAAGETVALEAHGIPRMVLADGPAGVRLQKRFEIDPVSGDIYRLDRFATLENRFFGKLEAHPGAVSRFQFATAIPVGTLLAQTFDPALLEEVGAMIAGELAEFGVAVWLAPGMNIHRNPLCGRNFEYYSEDPLVAGTMAAAITRGVQQNGRAGTCIKHYACNNQEDNRFHVTSNLSERALRELYLKGFEIAVKTAQPLSIMTSYNRVNSVHTANSYDLCTTVARDEWGFAGFIMTDWTTTNGGHGSSAAKCILAGNDLVMPGTAGDRREILEALRGENDQRLPVEKLDESVTRIVYAALKHEG